MSTIFRLDVLDAGHGDCLWVEYGEVDSPRRILIDGGTKGTFKRLKPRLEAVRGSEPSHELLIVTHVDEDHIRGILPVLEDPALAKQFESVWFNGRHHLTAAAGEEDLHGGHGELLSTAIDSQGLPWNAAFKGGPAMRDQAGRPVTVELAGGARVTVLTPGAGELAALIPDWDAAVVRSGIHPAQPQPQDEAADGEESFVVLDMEALTQPDSAVDTAPANGSSISVLVEFEGKRMLLAADAHPGSLISGIKGLDLPVPLEVDLFKLPHHGSRFNVTDDLLNVVSPRTVVISTNGKKHHHPNPEAIARVVKHYRGKVELVFSHESDQSSVWNDAELKQEWGYTTRYGTGQVGISMDLL